MPSKEERRRQWKEAEKDTVILHMFQRGKNSPNPSPFVLKLETFLRMADIKYEVDFTEPFSKKGKSPWVTFNGEDLADSQFIIEKLSEDLSKDLSKKLSDKEKATARSVRIMLEDHLYWVLASIAAIHQKGQYIRSGIPPLPVPGFMQGFAFSMMIRNMQKQAHAQGIGRHSLEETEKLGIADLKAVSDLLGDKNFMMGKEPTELDAIVFAFTAMILNTDPEDKNGVKKAIEEDLTNLKRHYERMREKFWADWDECLYVDEKAKAKAEEEERKKKEKEEKEKEKEKEKEEADKKEEDKKEEAEDKDKVDGDKKEEKKEKKGKEKKGKDKKEKKDSKKEKDEDKEKK